MNINKILISGLISAALVSCTAESLTKINTDGSKTQIVNVDEIEGGVIIVKFSSAALPSVEDAVSNYVKTKSSEAPTSGIRSVDEIFEQIQVIGLERVFPTDKKHEAETKAAGLDRWYAVYVDKSQDLVKAKELLGAVSEISEIQFSNKMYKADEDNKIVPFTAAMSERKFVSCDFNDPNLFWQWGYINNADQAIATEAVAGMDIDVADAWKLTGGDSRVIVAVLDEGIKYTHPDLAANVWTNPNETEDGVDDDGNGYVDDIHGYNFVDNGAVTWDKVNTGIDGSNNGDSGHGTHVAGTIAAVNNNGIGVAGVAGGTGNGDGVKLMSCQIFSGGNSAADLATSRAVKYAADNGACILQCSYGLASTTSALTSDKAFRNYSPLLVEALEYFYSKKNCDALEGGIAIYAAGNDGASISSYPGAYSKNISVTAIGPDGLPAYYTNYGPGCNIAAPGGETVGFSGNSYAGILSTVCSELPDTKGADYAFFQGTSMACPHVSGVAALGLSYALKLGKTFTRDEYIAMLLSSVNDIQSRFEGTKQTGTKITLENYANGKMGTGLIDAYQLLMQIEGTPCVVIPAGSLETVTLDKHFGGSAKDLSYYKDVEISDSDKAKLGVEMLRMYNGQLMVKCSKTGSAYITVSAIAGGNKESTDSSMGGMKISKKFAIVVRESCASNGGWL